MFEFINIIKKSTEIMSQNSKKSLFIKVYFSENVVSYIFDIFPINYLLEPSKTYMLSRISTK